MEIQKQEISILKRVNQKSVRVACNCGQEYTHNIDGFEPKFIEEVGQYENLTTGPCPECNSFTVFNLNIPETEADDVDQAPFLPPLEAQQREPLRELIWKVRPDLDEAEREKVEQQRKEEIESHFNADLETIKQMFYREVDPFRE